MVSIVVVSMTLIEASYCSGTLPKSPRFTFALAGEAVSVQVETLLGVTQGAASLALETTLLTPELFRHLEDQLSCNWNFGYKPGQRPEEEGDMDGLVHSI